VLAGDFLEIRISELVANSTDTLTDFSEFIVRNGIGHGFSFPRCGEITIRP
jgi:hypothetical protein